MSRAKRLEVVLELAERDEQEAARALETARLNKEQDEQKLLELIQYHEDYELAFKQPLPLIRAEQMQRQRGFLVQLSQAREQQEMIVKKRCDLLGQKQQLWQRAHLKRKAMAELIDRMRNDEARTLDKKEEKMLDEWFTQSAQRRAENLAL